ncbi:MAG: right-handed parallel beta-helix repeat-containing protein [Solirubrobacterales bacterium]|nr:right-handed parallel beta-helix repeat-containing protein [Solirubrobacterales bacterium]
MNHLLPPRRRRAVLGAFVGASSAALFLVAGAQAHGHAADSHPGKHGHQHGPRILYVSTKGASGQADKSCRTAAYSSVQSAVNDAASGAMIVVCGGTYSEDVVISTPLTLMGHSGATIQGVKTTTFTCDQLGPTGPGHAPCLAAITIRSSHVTVAGFTVKGAIGEGILATGSLQRGSIRDVTIEHNRVAGNDTGGIPPSPTSPYPQCAASGQVPGDCGEGIHLMGVYHSEVVSNFVSHNSGGVLLTDEFGPTHDNLIEKNVVTKNLFDCGVTAPGHNPNALDKDGKRQPNVAGVYGNVIRANVITGNGTQGEGAGVLFANASAGTGSYDNLVQGNFISGNELSGVTMHAHTIAPGAFEDLSGNRVIGNTIGRNNVGSPHVPGDPLDGSVTDPETTGVLVFSASVPVTVTIAHNKIAGDHFGIWLGVAGQVRATLNDNRFRNVNVAANTAS